MSLRSWAIVPLLLLCALPLTQAQVPASDYQLKLGPLQGTIIEDKETVIPYMGNATVDVTLTVGCALVLQNAPALNVPIAFDAPPAWLVAKPLSLSFGPADCANPAATAIKTGTLAFSVGKDAPGIETQTPNVTAISKAGTQKIALPFEVQYHADYTVVPDVTFPMKTVNGYANFTISVTQHSNARSMVMFEEAHASTGTIKGLSSVVYMPPETKVFKISYVAPGPNWSNATVEFRTASHYLLKDQRAGTYHDVRTPSWQFSNPGGASPSSGSTTSAKSPAVGPLLAFGLLGAALLAQRRLR